MNDTTQSPATHKDVVIEGISFSVSTPYAEGQTLTAVEASVLNQVRCENVRNNKRKAIKDAIADAGVAVSELPKAILTGLANLVAEYDGAYVFNMHTASAASKDPVEKEALKIARSLVTAALKTAGKMVKDVDPDKLADKIAEVATGEEVIKAAKKALAERAKAADTVMDIGDL